MILWLDAQLSPHLAPWIVEQFSIEAQSLRFLGLERAEDLAVFRAARTAGASLLTKDDDFKTLVEELGPPPQILWLRCGNNTNRHLRTLLAATLPDALMMLREKQAIVEISEAF